MYIYACTLQPWGPSVHSIYKELSKRLVKATRDLNAGLYSAQRKRIAIQRGNAASGTVGHVANKIKMSSLNTIAEKLTMIPLIMNNIKMLYDATMINYHYRSSVAHCGASPLFLYVSHSGPCHSCLGFLISKTIVLIL